MLIKAVGKSFIVLRWIWKVLEQEKKWVFFDGNKSYAGA